MCVYILKEGVGALQIRQTNFLTCLEMSDSLMIPYTAMRPKSVGLEEREHSKRQLQ